MFIPNRVELIWKNMKELAKCSRLEYGMSSFEIKDSVIAGNEAINNYFSLVLNIGLLQPLI